MRNQIDREKIHFIRIHQVSDKVLTAYRAFNNPNSYVVLESLNKGFDTSYLIAQDTDSNVTAVSGILSRLKTIDLVVKSKHKEDGFYRYRFNTKMMDKIKDVAMLKW